MKKLFAVVVLTASTTAFASPVLLNEAALDSVTAGSINYPLHKFATKPNFGSMNTAVITQVNASPVTITQVNALTEGGATNYAALTSGNVASVKLTIK